MGHLINPIAFRLGWSMNWCDSWFSELSYYPEFLHYILKLRLYLTHYLHDKSLYDSSILVSHFIIFFKSNTIFVNFFFYPGLYMEYYYNAQLKDQDFMFFLKGGKYLNPRVKPHQYAPELVLKNKSLHDFLHKKRIQMSVWNLDSFRFIRKQLKDFGGLDTLLRSRHTALFYSFLFLSFFKPFFLYDVLFQKMKSLLKLNVFRLSYVVKDYFKYDVLSRKRFWFAKHSVIKDARYNWKYLTYSSKFIFDFFKTNLNKGFFFNDFLGFFLPNRSFFFFPRYKTFKWRRFFFKFYSLSLDYNKIGFWFYRKYNFSKMYFNYILKLNRKYPFASNYFFSLFNNRKLFFSLNNKINNYFFDPSILYNRRNSLLRFFRNRRNIFKRFNKSVDNYIKYSRNSKFNLKLSSLLLCYDKVAKRRRFVYIKHFLPNTFEFNKIPFFSRRNFFLNSFYKQNYNYLFNKNIICNLNLGSFFFSIRDFKNQKLQRVRKEFFFEKFLLRFRKRRFFSFFRFFFRNRLQHWKDKISSNSFFQCRSKISSLMFFGKIYNKALFFYKSLFVKMKKFSINWFLKYFSFNSLNSFVDFKYLLVVVLLFKTFIFTNKRNLEDTDIMPKVFLFFSTMLLEDKLRNRFSHLEYMLSKFMPFFKFNIVPFIIENANVTAAFIAKFFAIKLSTGHSVRMLANAVSSDLRSMAVEELGMNVFSSRYDNFFSSSHIRYKSLVMKVYIMKFLLIYKRLFLRFFHRVKTWFSLYSLWYYIWIYQNFNKYGESFFIGISKLFFLRKYSFNLFFSYDFRLFSFDLNNIFENIYRNIYSPNKNAFLYFHIFDDLFSSYNLILSHNFSLSLELTAFKAANIFFNRLLTYHYWVYNYKWIWAGSFLNKRSLRLRKESTVPTFFGYKLQFRGRFSRKQRADSIVFRKGLVPLNTLSVKIDYGCTNVPLFNSLVSIKVWLYKHPDTPRMFDTFW